MKVLMAKWVGEIKNLPSWFKHDEEADVSWEQIKELFDTGNNIMLYHSRDGYIGLYVDNKIFTQR